jgi:ketosteroid isomerase-like protein
MPPLARLPVGPLERLSREFWAHFDAKDHEALVAMMTADAMETDDLAQSWLRGRAAIGEHFAGMGERYEDSQTVLEDVEVTETTDTAVVTCVVHYQMRWDGQPGSWRWPTTMIFVRQGGVWRLALLHTK